MTTEAGRPNTLHEPERSDFRAMATDVTLLVCDPTPRAAAALDEARAVFHRVESACTRFDPASPLMRANRDPDRWHDVPRECADAIREAARAHQRTGGVFDPRVLEALLRLGYDRSLPFAQGAVEVEGSPGPRTLESAADETAAPRPRRPQPWRPRVEQRGGRHRIHLGGTAIDLGGIGKGLAVRWAWERLRDAGGSVMVDAGGDCRFSGLGPDGRGWHVGVEDPLGGETPVAVLVLTDASAATSSIRVRRWQRDGRTVHHLIDPTTGDSGGDGLLAVTVIGADPAWAEVWSKVLFLAGPEQVATVAATQNLPAVWVEADGAVRFNDAARPNVLWTAAGGYL